jgi:hypothetical protein
MPAYKFSLDSFVIEHTRARHNDTVHASFALKVGQKTYGPEIRHLGDLNDGPHEVGIVFDGIEIDDPTAPVVFNYQITNMGHDNNAKNAEKALKAGTDALFQHYQEHGPSTTVAGVTVNWFTVIKIAVQTVFGLIFGDCDGPVAVDQVIMSGKQVLDLQAPYTETRRYEEKSQEGCGKSSIYFVKWSVWESVDIPPLFRDYMPHLEFPPPK